MWGYRVKRECDLSCRNNKLGKAHFAWERSHICWTSKKRGLRSITNVKKHAERIERRKVKQQLKQE